MEEDLWIGVRRRHWKGVGGRYSYCARLAMRVGGLVCRMRERIRLDAMVGSVLRLLEVFWAMRKREVVLDDWDQTSPSLSNAAVGAARSSGRGGASEIFNG